VTESFWQQPPDARKCRGRSPGARPSRTRNRRFKVSTDTSIDSRTLARLIDLGRDSRIDDPDVVRKYEDLRHSDALNRLHWRRWERVVQDMPVDDLVALIRGLAIAERRFRWLGGSVSAVIWTFRVLSRRCPEISDPLGEWISRRSDNTYVPYGTHRDDVVSRAQLDALDTMSPEERDRWFDGHRAAVQAAQARSSAARRRNISTEMARQGVARAVREGQNAARRRHLLARHWASRPAGWDAPAAAEWKAIIERADSLAPAQRVAVVAENCQIPIDFFPSNWADCSVETLGQLSADARQAILSRLAPVANGRWHSLAVRVAGLDKRC